MTTAWRIFSGALLGLGVTILLLVIAIFVLEAAYARGVRYDDLTVARIFQALLVAGPIVGAWLRVARRPETTKEAA